MEPRGRTRLDRVREMLLEGLAIAERDAPEAEAQPERTKRKRTKKKEARRAP